MKNHSHVSFIVLAATTALLSPTFACGRGVSLDPGTPAGSGGAGVDANSFDGGGATETQLPTTDSPAGCPCAPGGTTTVITCGKPWPTSAGRDAPDAVMTPDGRAVAINRCVPDAKGDCGSGLFLWTAAVGTTKLADDAWGFALSADGQTVLGEHDLSSTTRVFLWNANTTVDLPFTAAVTHLLSADGTVVVSKDSASADDVEAARWTASGGVTRLGDLPGGPQFSEPLAMTADASSVVGYGNTTMGQDAFLWTAAAQMIDLGLLPNAPTTGVQNVARAISADGKTVAGTALGFNGTSIFRWTAADGMIHVADAFQSLPFSIPGLSSFSFYWTPPLLVSADGVAVIGTAAGADPMTPMAFRWTKDAGVVSLAAAGLPSIVRGASLDGNRVLGSTLKLNGVSGPQTITTPPTHTPFIWDNVHSDRDLGALMQQGGANLTGVVLGDPIALSADGTTVVGHAACGASEIIFRATLPPN